MRMYGLIGYPLSHSFSKKYFADKFLNEGLNNCIYENFAIPSIDEFKSLIKNTSCLFGLNVTIPYKQQVIPYLHHVNEVVEKTGACNCIKIENDVLHGYNTDVIGFEQSLKKFLQPHHTNALVLGNGGAAKAVKYVLDSLRIEYLSVSRSRTDMANSLIYDELSDELVRSHSLIINTTPLGTSPDIELAPPINYEMITPSHYLFDLIYNPEKTLFLKRGEAKGASIQNGFEMLIIQAEESWKIWNSE